MRPSVSAVLLLFLFSLTPVELHLRVSNLRATDLPADILGIADSYVKLFVNGVSLGQTSVKWNKVNPVWDENFKAPVAVEADILRVEVHDRDLLSDDLLGSCQGQVQSGVHQRECVLQGGGRLFYTYELEA